MSVFRLAFVSIKLIKEDAHYIFTIPMLGIYQVRNNLYIFNKIIYSLLVVSDIHLNS